MIPTPTIHRREPLSLFCLPILPSSRSGRGIALAAFLSVSLACGKDAAEPAAPTELPTDPVPPAETPADPEGPPVDSVESDAILDTRSPSPGIVFGSSSMPNAYLDDVHTGWMTGGPLNPSNILSWLADARGKGGRVVIKLSKGRDQYVKNADGTFSLTQWKSLVSRYAGVDLDPYIADGTIVGHYLIDEPHRTSRWGGKTVSHATLEEMASFSKQIWPEMTTIVRVVPSWLASASITYQHLDAGWTQYVVGKGDAASWVAAEAAAAKGKGLGMVVGLNVLDGGNGSSKIPGSTPGEWAMSASELRDYGSAMLSESRSCAFFNRAHDEGYYGGPDVRSAMAELSAKAKLHVKTSCRQ